MWRLFKCDGREYKEFFLQTDVLSAKMPMHDMILAGNVLQHSKLFLLVSFYSLDEMVSLECLLWIFEGPALEAWLIAGW